MTPPTLVSLVAKRTIDPDTAALAWLLVEGGVSVVVIGSASLAERTGLANALVTVDPRRPAVVIDADTEPPTIARLAALLQGGTAVGLVSDARSLEAVLERFHAPPAELPYDELLLWAWTAVLSGFVLVPVFTGRGDAVVPIGLVALALLLFTLLAPRMRRGPGASGTVPAGTGPSSPAPTDADEVRTAEVEAVPSSDGQDRVGVDP